MISAICHTMTAATSFSSSSTLLWKRY